MEVSIVNKNELDVNRDTLSYQECDGVLWNPYSIEFVKCVRGSLYSIRNETQCPKIDVKYSELFIDLKDSNTTVIESMFSGNKSKTDEDVMTIING